MRGPVSLVVWGIVLAVGVIVAVLVVLPVWFVSTVNRRQRRRER